MDAASAQTVCGIAITLDLAAVGFDFKANSQSSRAAVSAGHLCNQKGAHQVGVILVGLPVLALNLSGSKFDNLCGAELEGEGHSHPRPEGTAPCTYIGL